MSEMSGIGFTNRYPHVLLISSLLGRNQMFCGVALISTLVSDLTRNVVHNKHCKPIPFILQGIFQLCLK